MNNNRKMQYAGRRTFQNFTRGLLVALAALAVCRMASAQDKKDKKDEFTFELLPNVTTPTTITPPVGNHLFLAGHAFGSQGYVCLPKDGSVSWTVNAARSEAHAVCDFLRGPVQIITHFLSHNDNPNDPTLPVAFGNATWQSSFDSSKVWAVASPETTIVAGTDPSCPNAGSIACLLLTAIGTEEGPAGGKILAKTTFVQRLNTKGGSAPSNPSTGCLTTGDVGHQLLAPYSADYFFFRAEN